MINVNSKTNIEERLQYQFKDPALLNKALTHKSYHFEQKKISQGHNEKLEFLGDAVVDLILSEFLMELFPEDEEGALSKKRASLVNENFLSQVANDLDLGMILVLGKGEMASGGERKSRILASTFEAIVGALFFDAGFEKTREIVRVQFEKHLSKMNDFTFDYKSELQEAVQAVVRETPIYEVEQESGPPHNRYFSIAVKIKGHKEAVGEGRSKKEAEQDAAKKALNVWKTKVERLKVESLGEL